MSFDSVAAVKHYHAVLEARDLTAVESCFAGDATYVSDGLGTLQGRVAIMSALQQYFAANPQHTSQDQEVAAKSDWSAESRWSLSVGPNLTRSGRETIVFDHLGKITSVLVLDDKA